MMRMSSEKPTVSKAIFGRQRESLIDQSETSNPLSGEFLENFRQMDFDEAVNRFTIFAAIVGVGVLLYNIDASVPHKGVATLQELLSRVPLEAFDSYESVLKESPIATKAATSATVYTIGDVISQRAEGISVGELDRPRILRSLLAGLIGHGPLSHYWFTILDNFFENFLHITQWWAFFPKVVVDQISWGPFWNNTYILLIGLMKLDSFQNIWSDMKRTTIPLIVSGLKLWPLAHCVTYGLVPQENRLLWVDFVEILWVTILATQAAAASGDRENRKNAEEAAK